MFCRICRHRKPILLGISLKKGRFRKLCFRHICHVCLLCHLVHGNTKPFFDTNSRESAVFRIRVLLDSHFQRLQCLRISEFRRFQSPKRIRPKIISRSELKFFYRYLYFGTPRVRHQTYSYSGLNFQTSGCVFWIWSLQILCMLLLVHVKHS